MRGLSSIKAPWRRCQYRRNALTFHTSLGYFYTLQASHIVHVKQHLLPQALAVITIELGAISACSTVSLKGNTTLKAKPQEQHHLRWITGHCKGQLLIGSLCQVSFVPFVGRWWRWWGNLFQTSPFYIGLQKNSNAHPASKIFICQIKEVQLYLDGTFI